MLAYRVQPLPAHWPGERTKLRRPSPFKVNWSSTIRLLGSEIRALKGTDVVLRLAVRPQDLRLDGGVKANARISDPSVVLEFKSGPDLLSFPCDRFNWWEDNVRAIALALEALRKVDRYGVRTGRQYEGFKALPSGAEPVHLGLDDIARELVQLSATPLPIPPSDVLTSANISRELVRRALSLHHPDRGGDPRVFQDVQQYREVLSKHHGVPL